MGIETALLVAAVGGTLMSGLGAMAQGRAAKKEGYAQAAREEAAGRQQAAQIRRNKQRLLSSQNAAFNAMGIGSLGNALDILEDTASEQELSAQLAMSNAQNRARSMIVQGRQASAQGTAKFIGSIGQAAQMGLGAMGGGGQMVEAPRPSSSFVGPMPAQKSYSSGYSF